MALYPVFLDPYRVCSIIDEDCKDPSQSDPWEDCVTWLDKLHENVIKEESINERVEFLKVKYTI